MASLISSKFWPKSDWVVATNTLGRKGVSWDEIAKKISKKYQI